MRLLSEAVRSAIAQPVATAITALIIAGVCATILSTTGQTVQVEQGVLSRIDAAGTRSVIISDAVGDAGITVDAVKRIGRLTGVEWVIGLGPASDVRAAGIPGGNPAAARYLYGDLPPQLSIAGRAPSLGEALVGPEAQQILGLQVPVGGVVGESSLAVAGRFQASDPLEFLNRSLIRLPSTDETILRSVHILVATPSQVSEVTAAALLLLGSQSPTSIAVNTSEILADVRAAVAGELGRFSRQLVGIVLATGLFLTALVVYGAVTSRRKDFGRRRAIGASRPTIIGLVAIQTGTAAGVGGILGAVASSVILTQTTGQRPDTEFTIAILVLATLTAVVAAIPPAVVAAYRDPVRVLRVP